MPDKSLVSQHNAITQARYSMTALQKNIVYFLLKKLSPSNQNSRYYELNALDLYDYMGGERAEYDKLKEATKGLTRFYIETFVPNHETGLEDFLQINLFSSVKYISGRGIIRIGLDDEIKPFLFDLKNNFTTFELETAISFRSVYSKRIYEGLNQFKNSENQEWYISVEELRKRLNVEEKFKKWSDFKRRVLDMAYKEINEYDGDIKFEIEYKKTSRKITYLIFHIDYKKPSIQVAESNHLHAWQNKKIDEELTGKEKKTLEYWRKLAVNDYQLKGVRNMSVFVAQFCEEFCQIHFKKSLGIYKGKGNFFINYDIYKPKTP